MSNINKRNIIIFFLLNLVRRFILFISVILDNYGLLILANIIKLGLFPFTHLILIFYKDLSISTFIILNICKLPYLIIVRLKIRSLLLLITIIYSLVRIYIRNSTIIIITVYRVVSRVIMLNLHKLNLEMYFIIRLLRIFLCLIGNFEVVSIYNLLRLPFRLTFYIKMQFLIRLTLLNIRWYVVRLTLIILIIIKYITFRNNISKIVFRLLVCNTLII